MLRFWIELIKGLLTNPMFYIVIIIGILGILFYNIIVGKAGEFHTNKELDKLPKDKYKVFYDIMIEANETTHQIDHIVTSTKGIFVIETKMWHGFITGGFSDKAWVIHYGKNKLNVGNPIRQNYGHIDALSKLLGVDKDKFINIVCFPGEVKLKLNKCYNVVYYYDLINKISSYDKDIVDNIEDINNKIINSNITDKKRRKEHIKYCKDKH